jgi:hypothetical protein
MFSFETKLRQGSDSCEGQEESNDLQGEAEHANDKIQQIHWFSSQRPWRSFRKEGGKSILCGQLSR